jgi:putative peptidoglycan lipid II flippase
MSASLQRIGIVSIATVLSRVLGLARDILTFAVFGTSALNSAFIFAFTLPNLFRRLLGEGALTAALVPTLSEELENNRRRGVFVLLNKVVTWLILVSVGVVGVAMLLFYGIKWIPGLEERWYLGADLSRILFPYMLFVCLAAVLAAALNVLGRFAVPALSAVWLNLAMIVALGVFGTLLASTPEGKMRFLCFGILAGGVIQVAVPCWALVREGWKPAADPRFSPRLKEISVLMVPGLAGAAIFQVNVVVSRVLAFTLDESAVAILYLANRLMELPLGIFTIAVTTVVFPLISRYAARGDFRNLAAAYQKGVGLILVITVPAAAGIILLREPILVCLFQWGAFGDADTRSTLPVLAVFALSLPFYSLAAHLTRGFYSLKDIRTPVRIAGVGFLVNLALSLGLMTFLGILGLALANLGSVILQSAMLQVRLTRRIPGVAFRRQGRNLGKIVVAAAGMSLAGAGLLTGLESWLTAGRQLAFVSLAAVIPAAVGVYGVLIWVLRVEGREDMEHLIRRFLRGKSGGGDLNL